MRSLVGTYNGGALTLGRELAAALDAAGSEAAVVFGGVLNEDDGGPLPVDARPQLCGARHPLRERDRAARPDPGGDHGTRTRSAPCSTFTLKSRTLLRSPPSSS